MRPLRHVFIFALLCLIATANAATLNVPSQYATIQAGINAAHDGDTVLIADGTYTGAGNGDLDFGGRNITVASINGPSKTIIDCQGTSASPHRGFYLHSGETAAAVRGLTVKNGYEPYPIKGGGMLNVGVSVSVQNCVLTGNIAYYGGGVSNQGSGTFTITNCTFDTDTAKEYYDAATDTDNFAYGGGISNEGSGTFTMTACSVSHCTASIGAGVYNDGTGSFSVSGCAVSSNEAFGELDADDNYIGGYGGGVENDGTGRYLVTNCNLTGNTAHGSLGGGVDNYIGAGTVTVTDCVVNGNSAYGEDYPGEGGGIANFNHGTGVINTTNCTVCGNYVAESNLLYDGEGGGIYNENVFNTGSITVTNCTVSGNTADGASDVTGGGIWVENDSTDGGSINIVNCIVYGNNTGEIVEGFSHASPTVSYCDVLGGFIGTGNINADPLFVRNANPSAASPDYGDFHLTANSPCIGAGTASSAPTTDLDGKQRNNPPCIGAYEFPLPAVTSIAVSPNRLYKGAATFGKVSLVSNAPKGGETVSLSSSNATVVIPPVSVLVPAGQKSATFEISTASNITVDTTATLTATAGGASATTNLNVLTRYTATGTVTVSGKPKSGVVVTATGSGTFVLTGNSTPNASIPDNSATGVTSAVPVSATGSITSIIVGLNITHPHIGDLLVTLTGPDGTSVFLQNQTGGSNQNIVTSYPGLTTPAQSLSAFVGKAAGGTWTLKVQDLHSGNVGMLNFWNLTFLYNGTLTQIATTASDGTFSIQSLKAATYTVTPSLTGYVFSPTSRSVKVGPNATAVDFAGSAAIQSLTLSASKKTGGFTVGGTVTLVSAAPTGGQVVSLSSSNTGAATVPSTVTVAAGATSATFNVTTKPTSSPTAVTIAANTGGASKTASLMVTPGLKSISVSPVSVKGGAGATGTVTLSGPAASDTSIAMTSSNSVATLPGHVTVPTGATSVKFAITTRTVSSRTPVTLKASLGITKTATLTITP